MKKVVVLSTAAFLLFLASIKMYKKKSNWVLTRQKRCDIIHLTKRLNVAFVLAFLKIQ